MCTSDVVHVHAHAHMWLYMCARLGRGGGVTLSVE